MKHIRKCLLTVLICAVVLLCIIPTEVNAADATSGSWGNLNWSYADNTLTITGTGAMPNSVSGYTYTYPWSSYSSRITSLVVGKGVTTVGNAVFQKMTTLTSISLPSTVTVIGDYAFWQCTNLRAITIPKGVVEIGEFAFAGCTNLKSITFGSKLETIGWSAFEGCTSLTKLTCPDSLKTIDSHAFSGCSNLTSVIFNDTLETIDYQAFYSCTRLASIEIPASVTSLGAGSNFAGCTALKTAVVNVNGAIANRCFEDCTVLTNVTIADTVTGIGEYAFMKCSSLPEITIPGSVNDIGISAFSYCSALKTVNLNEGLSSISQQVFRETAVHSIKIPDSVTNMGGYVFWDCTDLVTAELGEGMSCVPNSTFYGCTALETVKLGRFVSSINSSAFYNCKKLTDINWPEFLTVIKNDAFSQCSNLTTIQLPDGVNTIAYNAFDGCTGLTEITIPGSIIEIGNRVFVGCTSLNKVKFEGNAPKFGNSVFLDVTADAYYPDDNSTWTQSVMKQYDGTITWIPYTYVETPILSISCDPTSGKPELSWYEIETAEKYQICRKIGKDGAYNELATVTDTNYTDATAETGINYYYRICAVAADGTTSDYCAGKSCTCHLPRPKATVKNTASTGKAKLSWEAVDGAQKYVVYRATSKSGEYSKVKTTTATSYTDSSAKVGKRYYYKVVAVHENSSANSEKSAAVSAIRDLAQPKVTVKNTASTGKAKLSWNAVDGAEKYVVYRATSKSGEYSKVKTTTATSYTDSSAKVGKRYYYKVVAVHENSSANSAKSAEVSAVRDLTQPKASVSLTSKKQAKVKWDAVKGAEKYVIYRATSKDGEYTKLKTTVQTSYTDKSVKTGKTYYYKVVAVHKTSSANSSRSVAAKIKVK